MFDAGSIQATLELNRDPFNEGIEQAKADQDELESNPITVTIRVDSGEADSNVAEFQAQTDELEADPVLIQFDADTTNANAAVAALVAQGDELESTPIIVPIAADPAEAQATLVGLEAQGDDLAIIVPLTVNPAEGEAALAAFSAQLAGIETEAGAVDLSTLTAGVDDLTASLEQLDAPGLGGLSGLASGAQDAELAVSDLAPALTSGAAAAALFSPALDDAGAAAGSMSEDMDAAQLSVLQVIDASESAGLVFDSLSELSNQLGMDLSSGSVAAAEFSEGLATAGENAFYMQTAMTGAAENVLPWLDGLDYSLTGAEFATAALAAGASDAQMSMLDFGGALGGVATAAEEAEVAVGGASGGGGLWAGISGLGDAMSKDAGAGIAMPGMIGALVAAAVLAIPVVGALIGVLGAFAAIGFTAFTGLAAFVLGSIGDFKNLEAAAKTALKAYEAVLKPVITPVINSAIPMISEVLDDMSPIASSAASAIGSIIKEFSVDLRSSAFAQSIGWIAANTGPALETIFHFVNNIAQALEGMGQTGQPFINMIERGLVQFSSDLNSFSTSNTFTDFVNWLVKEGPVIGEDLESIGKSLGEMFVGLSPAGMALLTVFKSTMSDLVPIVGLVGKALSNPAIDGFALAIGGALIVVPLLGSALTALVGAVESAGLAIFTTLLPAIGELAVTMAPVIAVLGALAIGFHLAGDSAAAATTQANAFLDGVTTESASTLPQLTSKLDDLHTKMSQLQGDYDSGKISLGAMGTAAQELQTAADQTSASIKNYNDNLTLLEDQTGLSQSRVEQLAQSIGINLDAALSPAQVRQFTSALQEQATQAGLTLQMFTAMSSQADAALQKMISAGNTAAAATKTAWASVGDAVTAFASSTLPPTASAIAQFYATSELQAGAFTQNVQKAIEAGYSPSLISSIIQAGPQQASQLLQGLVNAQGTGLQTLISQATAAMSAEGLQAVQEARLTAEAVAAPTSAIAAALPTALAISQALTTSNAFAQVQTVANSLSGGLSEVLSVAHQYGISLPTALQAQIAAAMGGGTALGTAAVTGVQAAVPAIQAIAQQAAQALPSALDGWGPAAQVAALGQTHAVVAGFVGGQSSVDGAAQALMTSAASAASSVGGWSNVGSTAGQGIAAGMELSQSYIDDAAANMMLQGLASAKSAAGNPKSPAPVFIPLGLTVPQGVAAGIEQGTPLVAAAAAAMMHAASSAAGNAAAGIAAFTASQITPAQGAAVGAAGRAAAASGEDQVIGNAVSGIAAFFATPAGEDVIIGQAVSGIAAYLAAHPAATSAAAAPPPNYNVANPSIVGGAPAPESPTAALSAISSLAQGYANSRGTTINSSPTISISVPQGTSAELASIIAAQVANALDDHDTALVAELAAI